MTKEQFAKEAGRCGFNTIAEFDNPFKFMDYCYRNHLTQDNSMTYIKEDGSGCFIAYNNPNE